MKITEKTVEYVAELARLNLTDDEKQSLQKDLQNILSYVDQLNELDTSDVEPTNYVITMKNVFRDDQVHPSYGTDEITKNAPSIVDGCYSVPQPKIEE